VPIRENQERWSVKHPQGVGPLNRPTHDVKPNKLNFAKLVSRPLDHLFLVLLVWCGTVYALDPRRELSQFGHEIWLTENGLPQNTVHAITQTKNGYIWIATEGGLARFDGVSFKVFDKQNTPEFNSNYIRTLLEDREGVLWIGTAEGLVRMQAGKFTAFTTRDGLPNDSIQSIYEDREGSLWVATAAGLGRLKGDSVTTFTTKERLIGGSIQALFEDSAGALWIGTPYGLSRFKDGKFANYTARDGLASNSVRAIQQTKDGRLWFGTLSGLSVFSGGRFTTYRIRDGLPTDRIMSLYADKEGTLLVGTAIGLSRYIDNRFTNFNSAEGLSASTILSMFEDIEGNLWIGTESGGVNLLKDTKFTTYSTRNGLSSDLVKSIHGNQNGDIWIGTDGGGLNLLRGGKLTNFTTKNGLASNVVLALFGDDTGNVWAGTPNGLSLFRDGKSNANTSASILSNDYVKSIYKDRQGYLWIGTRGGLTRMKDGVSKTYTEADGLPNDLINAVCEDSEGVLWIGSLGGLSRFKDDAFTTYTTADGLSSDLISSLYEDSDGTLWIGTNGGGLNRLKDGKFSAFTTQEGLLDDVIYSVLEDNGNNIWLSCSKGIFHAKKTDFDELASGAASSITPLAYGTADGMLTRECSGGGAPAGWKDNSGRLWFTTIKGVAMIDPQRIRINEQAPPVVIEQLRIDDDQSIATFGEAELPPGKTRFDFYYTAPSFVAPEKVRFKYKLEGFDRDWIDSGTRRIAYYTNLRPGNYRFRVIASNNDGVWNQTGASFGFYLKPYFYQTYWFYAFFILGLALIGWQLYRFRVNRMEAQFSAVLAERARLAREIHDNLAQEMLGISVQLEVVARTLPASAELAKSNLDRVRILVRHSIAEARRYVWDLRSQALEKDDLPTALANTARRLTNESSIQVQVEVSGSFRPLNRLIEDNLLRVGQEAINNAVKHAQAQRIFVNLVFDAKRLQLSVRDDGRGFDYQAGKASNHFGLVGMRERAAQIGGTLSIHTGNGAGTEVVVNVPIN
jgi:ligand-binding sensor domain-containing protein/signal transduction histidine kinase